MRAARLAGLAGLAATLGALLAALLAPGSPGPGGWAALAATALFVCWPERWLKRPGGRAAAAALAVLAAAGASRAAALDPARAGAFRLAALAAAGSAAARLPSPWPWPAALAAAVLPVTLAPGTPAPFGTAALAGALPHLVGTLALALLLQGLQQVCARLEARVAPLRRAALTDGLTGLYNYRTILACLDRELAAARRSGKPLAVLLVDLDHFKRYNDAYGHLAGDEVLRRVGAAIQEVCRYGGIPGRYGGDEFLVILPGAGAAEAVAQARRITERLFRESLRMARDRGRPVSLSASVGAAVFPQSGQSRDALIAAADAAMYEAKGLQGGGVHLAAGPAVRP